MIIAEYEDALYERVQDYDDLLYEAGCYEADPCETQLMEVLRNDH